jgi:GH15 family glucan-1,4-alpha-glucosidase
MAQSRHVFRRTAAVPLRIENYALIGNTRSAALVGNDGSIDWLCLPRFDSDACFAALLGDRGHGHWQIAPVADVQNVRRAYRPETLVLETDFTTADGVVRIVDCMPPWEGRTDVVRVVVGVKGAVRVRMSLVIRFGYGAVIPWVRRDDEHYRATPGTDSLE